MPTEVPSGAHGQQYSDHLQQGRRRHPKDDDRDLVGADEDDAQDHAEDTPEEDAQNAVGLVQPREESFSLGDRDRRGRDGLGW